MGWIMATFLVSAAALLWFGFIAPDTVFPDPYADDPDDIELMEDEDIDCYRDYALFEENDRESEVI